MTGVFSTFGESRGGRNHVLLKEADEFSYLNSQPHWQPSMVMWPNRHTLHVPLKEKLGLLHTREGTVGAAMPRVSSQPSLAAQAAGEWQQQVNPHGKGSVV